MANNGKVKHIVGDLKTIKIIDEALSSVYDPIKDTSGRGLTSYTKTYEIVIQGNPHPKIAKIRIWFNEEDGIGTIKVRHVPYGVVAGVGTYVLVQAAMLIQQTIAH